MFEIEKFIEEMKKRPVLWDHKHASFMSRRARKHAWLHVAVAMFPNYKSYTSEKREEIMDDLQRKWKNLRDYYLRSSKSNSNIGVRRVTYFDLMSFLNDRHPNNKSAQGNKNELVDRQNTQIDAVDDFSRSNVCGKPSTSSNTYTETNSEADPDKDFLLSLLPDIETMTQQQKFEFKLGMMNLINSIKYANRAPLSNVTVQTNRNGISKVSEDRSSSEKLLNDSETEDEDCEIVSISGIPVKVRK